MEQGRQSNKHLGSRALTGSSALRPGVEDLFVSGMLRESKLSLMRFSMSLLVQSSLTAALTTAVSTNGTATQTVSLTTTTSGNATQAVALTTTTGVLMTVALTTAVPTTRNLSSWECSNEFNFIIGVSYSQTELTDRCGSDNVCNRNPKYVPQYASSNSVVAAVAFCKAKCEDPGWFGSQCTGFFFQRHTNGHEICGFYTIDPNAMS